MPAPKAVTVSVQFEDGRLVQAPLDALPDPLVAELLRQPFARQASPDPEADRFALFEWEDGWREVVRVDPACTDVGRYYVITRPEDAGRLSLTRADGGYPELVEVGRRPGRVSRLAFQNTYRLTAARAEREGSKVDRHFTLTPEGDLVAELREQLLDLLREEGLVPDGILPGSEAAKAATAAARRGLGLRAHFNEQDLDDFVMHLIRTREGDVQ